MMMVFVALLVMVFVLFGDVNVGGVGIDVVSVCVGGDAGVGHVGCGLGFCLPRLTEGRG